MSNLEALIQKYSTPQLLLKSISGSRLYGTNRANSDQDYIEILAPKFGTILTGGGEKSAHIQHHLTGEDIHQHTLHAFIMQVSGGAMINMEALYAPTFAIIGTAHPIIEYIRDTAQHFIDPNLPKAVGFCTNMLNTYASNPWDRVEYLSNMLAYIRQHHPENTPKGLDTVVQTFIVQSSDSHTTPPTIEQKDERVNLHLYGRLIDLNQGPRHLVSILESIHKRYRRQIDQRDTASADRTKGLMHAVRIAEQIQEYRADSRITFPRPNAEELRAIRENADNPKNNKYVERVQHILQSVPKPPPDPINRMDILGPYLCTLYQRIYA